MSDEQEIGYDAPGIFWGIVAIFWAVGIWVFLLTAMALMSVIELVTEVWNRYRY